MNKPHICYSGPFYALSISLAALKQICLCAFILLPYCPPTPIFSSLIFSSLIFSLIFSFLIFQNRIPLDHLLNPPLPPEGQNPSLWDRSSQFLSFASKAIKLFVFSQNLVFIIGLTLGSRTELSVTYWVNTCI